MYTEYHSHAGYKDEQSVHYPEESIIYFGMIRLENDVR